jgi:hypothetical protein
MSDLKLKSNSSGSGGVTINSPDTNLDYDLTLPAADGTLLHMNSSGNVGIGDPSPSEKLNVAGNIMLEGADQYMYLSNVGTYNSGIYVRGISSSSTLRSHSTGQFTWEVAGSEKMRIASSGRVGIGTSSPDEKLHVAGNIRVNNNQEYRSVDTGGNNRTIMRINSSDELEYGWSGSGPVKFMGGGSYTEIMRIHTNGNVGIGTESPDSKLHVSGNSNTNAPIAHFELNDSSPADTPTVKITRADNLSVPTSVTDAALFISDHSSNWPLSIRDHNSTDLLAVKGDGCVHTNRLMAGVGTGSTVSTAYNHWMGGHTRMGSWGTDFTHPGVADNVARNLDNSTYAGMQHFISFTVYFPNGVSNLGVRLYNPSNSWWGSGEIIIGSSYSNQNASGFRRYLFTHNRNTTSNYNSDIANTDNAGSTSAVFELNSQGYDSTEGAHYWEFRHLSSPGNNMHMHMRLFGNSPDMYGSQWYVKPITF